MKVAEFLSRMTAFMQEVGRSEFECPEPHGNRDPMMHQFLVTTTLAAYFKKRREEALNDMLLAVNTQAIDQAEADAINDMRKQEIELMTDTLYRLRLEVKSPGGSLNVTKLKTRLEVDGRYTSKEIESLIDNCTSLRKPAKSFIVEANDG